MPFYPKLIEIVSIKFEFYNVFSHSRHKVTILDLRLFVIAPRYVYINIIACFFYIVSLLYYIIII